MDWRRHEDSRRSASDRKVRAGDKFVTSEPKGSIPLLQSSSCNARVHMVGALEIKVGVDGGTLNLVQRQA